jgi:polyhydroxybutyrate depolymerase
MAGRNGYVVAYPKGIGIFALLRHRNSGFCCGRAARTQMDDVEFITWVIHDIEKGKALQKLLANFYPMRL